MSKRDLRHYADLVRTHPRADLGDERTVIEILRENHVPEDLIDTYLDEIIEIARTL